MNRGTFVSKLSNYITSSREMSIQNENNVLTVSYFHITADDIKECWLMGVFLIVGFGILPIVFGFAQVLMELLKENEYSEYSRYYMYYLLVFYWIPPLIVFRFLIIPLFSIRTIVMESKQLSVFDCFFGTQPKLKKRLRKNHIQDVTLNKKLLLIHEGGQYEIMSGHPPEDMSWIKSTLKDYIHNSKRTLE
ncbi:MAG: hypothetical protein D3926_05930 [Desulfobacteraceae bacterium]|nr:MAG: hypothetical protein D3926_05930 [Desulfobacteraceae bacterium]